MTLAQIHRRLSAIERKLLRLVCVLNDEGFHFHNPDSTLPGVDPKTEMHIEFIKDRIGPVPVALAEFWRKIGSVDLTGRHNDWTGCSYPDPLVVEPSASAFEEANDYIAEIDSDGSSRPPFRIPVSPDFYHKENVSGGMWYHILCPDEASNPLVRGERNSLPFLEYVEHSLEWGGFLGLKTSADHTWPLMRLTVNE